MWFLLSSRLRQWLFMVVAVPLLGRLLAAIGRWLEARRGSSRVSTELQRTGALLNQRSRGQQQRQQRWGRRGQATGPRRGRP